MRRTSMIAGLAATLLFAFSAGCDGGEGEEGDGGARMDGATALDGAPMEGDGGPGPMTDGGPRPDGGGLCAPEGEACEASVECCDGRRCESDGAGGRVCGGRPICLDEGRACTRAAECCSLACDGTCRPAGDALCRPVGEACDEDRDCCSDDCDGTCRSIGGGCAPLGERCTMEGRDPGCCSRTCVDTGEGDLRCGRASACGARGEICADAADCCSGVCQDGRCPTQDQIGGQRFAGEPCDSDADCASYACAPSEPGGPTFCQFLGGCRPIGEICTANWQCCADIHLFPPMCAETPGGGVGCVAHSGVDGLSVCGGQIPQTGPKEPGEICEDSMGNTIHTCCPEEACELSRFGVWRCAGPGGTDECVDDDEPCRTADQCCSGICSPHPTGDGGVELRCGPCVEVDGLCTTDADCCGFTCVDGVCGDEPVDVCVPIGGPCEVPDDCCSSLCSNGSCYTLV